jgi:hypothetical protein
VAIACEPELRAQAVDRDAREAAEVGAQRDTIQRAVAVGRQMQQFFFGQQPQCAIERERGIVERSR